MKLSTRSRYGTRMILDMAQHYNGQPIQLGEISKRQNVSLKYLEQIIRPLKEAKLVKSFRGSKGGHMLTKAPEEITVGEIVAILEGGDTLIHCDKDPKDCERVDSCLTRYLWVEAASAMFQRLSAITFADLLTLKEDVCKNKIINYLTDRQKSNSIDN